MALTRKYSYGKYVKSINIQLIKLPVTYSKDHQLWLIYVTSSWHNFAFKILNSSKM